MAGILVSIWLLGHFGGVGAKVRRGYGTIALEKWEAKNCEKLQSMIDKISRFYITPNHLKIGKRIYKMLEIIFVVNHDPNDEQSHTILDHHSSLFVSVVNDKCADKVTGRPHWGFPIFRVLRSKELSGLGRSFMRRMIEKKLTDLWE